MNRLDRVKEIVNLPPELEGVEVLEIIARNVNGNTYLFTPDGKLVGWQIGHMGHYYYLGKEHDRTMFFRSTIAVARMIDDVPEVSDGNPG